MTPSPSERLARRPPFPTTAGAFLFDRLRRRAGVHLGVLALVVGAVTASVGAQYAMKLLIDALAGAGARAATEALVLFLGLIVTENALWRTSGWCGAGAILRMKAELRLDLFSWLTGQSPRFFADHLAGSLAGRVGGAGELVHGMAGTLLWAVLPPLADFLGAVVVLATVDVRMSIVLALAVISIAGALVWTGLRGRPLHARYARHAAEVGGELVDVLGNVWTVNAFAAAGRERGRLATKVDEERLAQRRAWGWLEGMRVIHDAGLCLAAGGLLAWALARWQVGAATAGDVLVVSALSFRVLHGSRDVALALVGVAQQAAQLGGTLRVVGAPHELVEAPGASCVPPRGGRVELRGVRFAWPGRAPLFESFELDIPPGQRVGVVGRSGAGKSTLLALLQRVVDVEAGAVRIDGRDVRARTLDALRAGLAVVPQDVSLFHRTILENVRYARPDATDAELRAALRVARCDAFIDALPEGWHTRVGERGVRLSGGQRQRLAIARALLAPAPILLFDEATSALDTESEQAIQAALEPLMGERTVIAVAHRLSTIARFDRVIVLEDGRIVEDGAPGALRRCGGVFDAMCRRQVEGLLVEATPGLAAPGR